MALCDLPELTLLLLPLLARLSAGDCPCSEAALCRQIRHRPDREVFVFDVGQKTWKSYDWSQITTVAAFGKYDAELMCHAHSKGARVVLKGDVSLKDIIDPSFRASWIAQKVDLAKTQYMDGINIDIEQEVSCSSPEYEALTALVRETTDCFHREIEGSQSWSSHQTHWSNYMTQGWTYQWEGDFCCDWDDGVTLTLSKVTISAQWSPGFQHRLTVANAGHPGAHASQVTFDVAWSPKSIDKRCYNYTGIADACDFLFVMSYDEQSQIWSECIAAANAPYNQTLTGYSDYIKMGISPKKLIMGIPWYGYDYICLNLSEDDICTIAKVPFRGAPCSDAAGHQVPYKVIMKQVNSSVSGSQWNKDQQAPYYNYKDPAGRFHQVWYDNPQSISLKAAYIRAQGLRGIGMWNANCLDYSDDAVAREQTEEMWGALKPRL